jgi:nifR3 family TIM-barrel protein
MHFFNYVTKINYFRVMLFKNNKLILAPMAGITDSVFRQICRQHGADIVVSEMVSAEGLFYNSQNTKGLLDFKPQERPIGIQLFGSNPEHLAIAAQKVEEFVHPDFIDLNSGCPVPKVVNKNGGASLLKDPVLFRQILSSMVKAVSTPVTVKIRSGWNKYEWVDTEFAKMAEDCGVAAITLHPRSQTMLFTGHSFWERITEIKKVVSIPVIGNGDICEPEDALKMSTETGCDSLMIGRGIYGNPWLFNQIKDLFGNRPYTPVTLQDRIALAIRHLLLFKDQFGELAASKEMKKHLGWYIKGAPDATVLRNTMFRTQEYKAIFDMLCDLEDKVTKG